MSQDRRVVVTGIGAVTGHGTDVDALWGNALRGCPAFREVGLFAASGHRTQIAAEAPANAIAGLAGSTRRGSRADCFAIHAGRAAAAKLPPPALATDRAGVFFGSSTGGLWEGERFLADLCRTGRGRLQSIASQTNDGPGTALARALAVRGPVLTFSTACTSANVALGMALAAIRSGEVDLALAGGADGLCEVTYAGFNSLRAVDPQSTRPFRKSRAGLSMGEGAGVLLLEASDHAAARGAPPLAELLGAGSSCDAHHVSAPEPNGAGAAAAIARALADVGASPSTVTFVNAHGTGTPHNDDAEAKAMHAVFGERARTLPLTSTKSLVGHLLGAAGGIEAVFTVLSIVHRLLPPTAGDEAPDPDLGLDVVVGAPRPLPAYNVGLSTNLAFGGNNAAVLFATCR